MEAHQELGLLLARPAERLEGPLEAMDAVEPRRGTSQTWVNRRPALQARTEAELRGFGSNLQGDLDPRVAAEQDPRCPGCPPKLLEEYDACRRTWFKWSRCTIAAVGHISSSRRRRSVAWKPRDVS